MQSGTLIALQICPGLHPYMDSSRFASEMFCFRT